MTRRRPTRPFLLTVMTIGVSAGVVPGCGERAAKQPPPPPTLSSQERIEAKNRAAGLMGQFRYADAVAVLEPIASRADATDDERVDLAIALLNRREEGDLTESARLLDTVIDEDPTNARALYTRALLLFNDGQTAGAERLFSQVAQLDGDDGYAVYFVGQSQFTEGRYREAAETFKRAQEIDPYLRSAYYGEFQAAQRLGEAEAARAAFATFERLADNPRARMAEIKYTRMGPKAEVSANGDPSPPPAPPEGPLFAEATPLAVSGAVEWRAGDAAGAPPGVSVADSDGDGRADLLLSRATSGGGSLLLRGATEAYQALGEHPLSGIEEVNAALWGDYDSDGLVDVYLCRDGANQLWRQAPSGVWRDVTDETETAGGDFNTVDGACYDVDHDGDLDYLLVNADGPRALLNNDRDGAFRSIAEKAGVAGDADGARRVIVADLDGDDDADLMFLNEEPPHEVLLNDRLWRYQAAEGFDRLRAEPLRAAVAVDSDVDGQTEIYSAGPSGARRWAPRDDGRWRATPITSRPASEVACYDFDGDTAVELLVREADRWVVVDLANGDTIAEHSLEDAAGELGILVTPQGPEVLVCADGRPPIIWRAGRGRYSMTLVRLVGREDPGAEMRSNASGIGVRGAARVGSRWAPMPEWRLSSAAGQSLQPHAIGTAGAEAIDFIRLLWPDGVSQTELDLAAGERHTIAETQRQAGSCPLLFVWNGQRHAFVADMLGAGGIGFNLGRGEYYPPRPKESLLLPHGMLQPRNGRWVIKLGEPMEEICYFDAVRLVAYDLPPGWRMTLDERFAGLGPPPTGRPVFYEQVCTPARAWNDRGEDVTSALGEADGQPAPLERDDRRFIGMTEPHSVTLEFSSPLDALENPTLLFHGWVEYAYSQSAFAAWQAGEEFVEPTLEAQDADGQWRVVAERFGYPAGTPREGSVPIPKDELPKDATRLRVTTNMQVYWDALKVVDAAPCPDARRSEMKLVNAVVDDVGFSERRMHEHRRPVYDYSRRPPLGDTRHPAGFYTAFGDATELVTRTDDAVAIIGPGEEVHFEFAAPTGRGRPEGWRRRWVVEADGWCKDADLFTRDAGTVAPLPQRSGARPDPRRDELHETFNTRYRRGY